MKTLLALLLIAGSYPDSQLKGWFDSLKSGKGPCCSFADGRTVATDDWGIKGAHYWVIVDGQKNSRPRRRTYLRFQSFWPGYRLALRI
jgi:hypothetical protein